MSYSYSRMYGKISQSCPSDQDSPPSTDPSIPGGTRWSRVVDLAPGAAQKSSERFLERNAGKKRAERPEKGAFNMAGFTMENGGFTMENGGFTMENAGFTMENGLAWFN